MTRFSTIASALVAGVLLTGCAPGDPLTGRAASDLPPGPLQPLPSETRPAAADCEVLEPSRGKTTSDSDADFVELKLTNTTNAECTVHGFPTLTMRDASGRNMGERATLRSNGAARYLVVKPGDSVTATIRYPKVDTCTSGASRIEVLIPGATDRAFVAESHPYCPGWSVSEIQRRWGE